MSLFPQSGFKHSKEETEAWNRYWEVTNMNIKIEVDKRTILKKQSIYPQVTYTMMKDITWIYSIK